MVQHLASRDKSLHVNVHANPKSNALIHTNPFDRCAEVQGARRRFFFRFSRGSLPTLASSQPPEMPVNMTRTKLIVILLTGTVASFTNGAPRENDSLQFEGRYEFYQYPLAGEPLIDRNFFRAEINKKGWRIRTSTSEEGLTNDWGAYHSCSGIGNLLFRLTSIGPGPRDNPQDKGNPIQKTASISKGEFPAFDVSHTSFIWLALASKPYFEKHGFVRSRPAWFASMASYSDPRGYLTTRIEFLEGNSNYYRRIEFLSDGNAFIDIPIPPVTEIKYPSPFDKGFVKAAFATRRVIGSNGRVYPAEFELVVNDPLPTADTTNDLRTACRLSGLVTAVRNVSAPDDMRPETVGLMNIIDSRHAETGTGGFQYISNGWKNDDDPELRALVRVIAQGRDHMTASLTFKRNVVAVLLVLTTLAFCFFVLAKRRRTKRTANIDSQQ